MEKFPFFYKKALLNMGVEIYKGFRTEDPLFEQIYPSIGSPRTIDPLFVKVTDKKP